MSPAKLLSLSLLFVFCVHADNTALKTDSFSKTTHFPQIEEAKRWKADDWSADDWAGFSGRPWIKDGAENCRLIRHKRFVVNYDTGLLDPRFTCHIDTKESAIATGQRPNSMKEWKRPSKFSPDPFLLNLFKKIGLPYVKHEDFSNSGYSRGHMTSNAEMKGFDQESQIESFLTSNILPQRQEMNGGIWSALEDDCLQFGKAFGRVYVITGGIFPPEPELKRVNGKMAIPTKLFKVLIAQKEGKLIAAGFLIDHKDGLKKSDLFKFQVPVDQIEKESGIDFMPSDGEPNSLEMDVNKDWEKALSN